MALDEFTEAVLRAYRGWDAFERANGSRSVIDLDLSPPSEHREWTTRSEILGFLTDAEGHVPSNIPDAAFVEAKLRASVAYLRAYLGEHRPFREFIEETIGITPQRFGEDEIEAEAAVIQKILSRSGVKWSRDSRQEFHRRYGEPNVDRVREGILRAWSRYRARLAALIGETSIPDLSVSFADVDEYWANWFTVSLEHGSCLQINVNPRVTYLRGSGAVLAAHELAGHATQAARWSAAIADGRMNPVCGLTTVHGPEQFVLEGVAQVMPYLIGDLEDEDEELARRIGRHRNKVLSNAHVMINEGDLFEDVFNYVSAGLPLVEEAVIESEIRDRSNDPLLRCYQFVYASSEDTLLQVAELNSSTQRSLLGLLFDAALTASETKRLLRER